MSTSRSVIRVRASYAEGELSVPKSGKVRSVPMVLDVGRHLASLAEPDDWTDEDDLVFADDDGGWLNDDKLRLRYRAAQRSAGLRRLRFHDLRHVFGSLATRRADIVEVRAWMGHADIQTTIRYLHYRDRGETAAPPRLCAAHACCCAGCRRLRSAALSPAQPTRTRCAQSEICGSCTTTTIALTGGRASARSPSTRPGWR
jgi:hypothetical protein